MSAGELLFCRLLGRHRYRDRSPRVFACEVYCLRCDRVFGSFDAPFARQVWDEDPPVRRRMMGQPPAAAVSSTQEPGT